MWPLLLAEPRAEHFWLRETVHSSSGQNYEIKGCFAQKDLKLGIETITQSMKKKKCCPLVDIRKKYRFKALVVFFLWFTVSKSVSTSCFFCSISLQNINHVFFSYFRLFPCISNLVLVFGLWPDPHPFCLPAPWWIWCTLVSCVWIFSPVSWHTRSYFYHTRPLSV